LEADLDHQGVYEVIYDGQGHPEYTTYVLTTVEAGNYYNFRYKAFNKNGESAYSDIFMTWACEVQTQPGTPTWITSTET
jgi:hypothetical protein